MSRAVRTHRVLPLVVLAAGTSLYGLSCVTTEEAEKGPDPRGGTAAVAPAATPSEAEGPAPVEVDFPLVVRRSNTDPIINVRVMFRSGSRDDPAGKEGLTRLTAALMSEATAKLGASGLREALFPWAAELGLLVDKETVVFTGRVHEDHADAFLPLLLDVVLDPRLDASDFNRVRTDQKSFVERTLRSSDDERLVREALEVELYDRRLSAGPSSPAPPTSKAAGAPRGGFAPGPALQVRHPYRHTPPGTVNGLAAITLDDVKAHIRKVFTRDRLVLGVSGGVKEPHLELLQRRLMTLPTSGPGAPRVLPPPPEPLETTMLIVDKPAAGTAISVGFHLRELKRGHPDYPAMKLAETWFGEHRNRVGWLFNNMRERRGLNYGDYAYVEHFVQQGWSTLEELNIGRHQQYFSIWIRPVEHKNRHWTLRQTVWELERFVERGIPDDESFNNIKAFVAGYWPSKEQQPMRRLGYLVDDVFYDDIGGRDALKAAVQKLTREEVNAAIRRHLRAERLRIVVVTEEGEAFKQAVLEAKPVSLAYPGTPAPALVEEDKLISVYDLGLKPQTIRVVTPESLFAR